jgi:hypothetical protein
MTSFVGVGAWRISSLNVDGYVIGLLSFQISAGRAGYEMRSTCVNNKFYDCGTLKCRMAKSDFQRGSSVLNAFLIARSKRRAPA